MYLTPEGLWHDKHMPSGDFLDEPAPASSLYHIVAAFGQIVDTERAAGIKGVVDLTLG
jgi:mannose/cellobiose epimerase-like protein (N-acyl-D-glucosamine 2-epimerase family)